MDMVSQVTKKVNEIFDEDYLDKLARKTGFIKRKRKIIPKKFIQNMLLNQLSSPVSSLDDLAFEFSKDNISVTKQALQKKCNSNTTLEFIKAVLADLLKYIFNSSTTYLGSIDFIKNVYGIDSSEIRLNKSLKNIFPQVRNQGAAVKLQSLIELANSRILSLEISSSKEPDQSYKSHLAYLQSDDLLIGDLGYFSVVSFKQIALKRAFFLSRYFKKTNLYDLKSKEAIDLRDILNQSKDEKIEIQIELGLTKFPCRLVAIKLTEEAYIQRLKALKEKRRKDPRVSKKDDILDQWSVFITNMPLAVDAETLLKLYSFRWQIELFFKMAKTFLKLREIKDINQQRAMISLHILLIALALLSLVVITIADKEISLYKASRIFIKSIREFMTYLNSENECAILWLSKKISVFALKETRKNRPSTLQSLEWRPVYA